MSALRGWLLFGLGLCVVGAALWLSRGRASSSKLARTGGSSSLVTSSTPPSRRAEVERSRSVAPASDAAPDELPAPLDCGNRRAVLATVAGSAIEAGVVCDELSITAGLGPIIGGAALRRFGTPLLDELVDAILVDRALASRGERVEEAEVRTELARARKGRPISEQEEAVLGRQVRARLSRARLIGKSGAAVPSSAEVAEEYSLHRERWAVRYGTARVEAFISRVPPQASPRAAEEARAVAAAFTATLRSGTPLAAVIPQAGMERLGTIDANAEGSEPELGRAVIGLGAGAVAGPVQTRAGWVVMRVSAPAESRPVSLDEASPEIRATLRVRRRQSEEERILGELRAESPAARRVAW